LGIGAHALAFYNQPRFTEDLDLWVGRSKDNAVRMQKALHAFGASIGDVGAQRFSREDRQMIRIGNPPFMVDILNFAGTESFEEVFGRSVRGEMGGVTVHYPSREDLISMKRSASRKQDLADIERLGG
jgi:hypothetical protein